MNGIAQDLITDAVKANSILPLILLVGFLVGIYYIYKIVQDYEKIAKNYEALKLEMDKKVNKDDLKEMLFLSLESVKEKIGSTTDHLNQRIDDLSKNIGMLLQDKISQSESNRQS